MNPLVDLLGLLPKPSVYQTGTVREVSEGIAKIATPTGVVYATLPAGVSTQVGREVLLKDGVVRGLVHNSADVPTYVI